MIQILHIILSQLQSSSYFIHTFQRHQAAWSFSHNRLAYGISGITVLWATVHPTAGYWTVLLNRPLYSLVAFWY